MNSLPTFSIIMPAFNAEEYIGEAIESVINQSLGDYELIIINDASTDDTARVISRYTTKDTRIHHMTLEVNKGVAHARNVGIKHARGRFIAFLDADDLWLPNKLEKQHNVFTNQNAQVVYSDYIRFSADRQENHVRVKEKISYKEMFAGNPIANLTAAYDQHALGKHYQKQIGHEDYLMWLNIVKIAERTIGIQEPLAKYRVRRSGLSANKLRAAKWVWHIYRNELKMGQHEAIACFIRYVINSTKKRL